ncbi:MAG: helix-turn-helix domain-containing protein [Sphingobium sp.]|nr:helix-turn-helix domain-containing protein [Sphingobium sp.]
MAGLISDESEDFGDAAHLLGPLRRREAVPRQAGRRPDPRAAATIRKILSATERMLLRAGPTRMSLRDVAVEAQVSRGTLYRYFSSKEQLRKAYTEFMRARFESGLRAAVEAHAPAERLAPFLDFFGHFFARPQAHQFLQAEPAFALEYFRDTFTSVIEQTTALLQPVFASWEENLGRDLDHRFLAEMIVRDLISNILVPAPDGGTSIAKLAETLGVGEPAQSRSRRRRAVVSA